MPLDKDERLEGQLAARHESLSAQIRDLLVDHTEITTILKRYIGEQQGINANLTKLVQRHEDRIQTLEQFRAVMDATLPKNMLNPEIVHAEIKELRKEQRAQRVQLTAISLAAGVVIWFLSWLIPQLFNHYFHMGN